MVVVDAGSSGSRVFLYRWMARGGALPQLELMQSRDGGNLVLKVEPGLSAFKGRPAEAVDSLLPLVQFAGTHIAPSLRARTPLYVLATAGLRMLDAAHTDEILQALQTLLPRHTSFRVEPDHVRLLSGQQEGLASWLAVNFVAQRLGAAGSRPDTVGSLDMGGGSAQIAFEVAGTPEAAAAPNVETIDLTPPGAARPVHYHVYVQTLLGFGANKARARYVRWLRQTNAAQDPCLPVGMPNDWEAQLPEYQPVVGSGRFLQCRKAVTRLFYDDSDSCGQAVCSVRQLPRPPIPGNMTWFGFSEYYYTHFDVFGLSGRHNADEFMQRALAFCGTEWTELAAQYAQGLYPNAQPHRFHHQCFKSAWMSGMLHHAYQIPQNASLVVTKLLRGVEVQWTMGMAVLLALQQQRARQSRPASLPLNWLFESSVSLALALLLVVLVALGAYRWRMRLTKLLNCCGAASCYRRYNFDTPPSVNFMV